jgi:hypothetical protein
MSGLELCAQYQARAEAMLRLTIANIRILAAAHDCPQSRAALNMIADDLAHGVTIDDPELGGYPISD